MSPMETLFVERKIVSANSSANVNAIAAEEARLDPARVQDLNRAISAIQSLATNVSRLPLFARRFTAVMRNVAAGGDPTAAPRVDGGGEAV